MRFFLLNDIFLIFILILEKQYHLGFHYSLIYPDWKIFLDFSIIFYDFIS